MNKICLTLTALFLLLTSITLEAQKNKDKKYPSLLWEITGNGLHKPSYLFGTMHVSNKMAFHLSDSFYNAISGAEAVALELNPDLWQQQMVTLDQLKKNYSNYTQSQFGDYLNEQSFRLGNYDNELKLALSTEPAMVNSLLYRSYKAREDFEEDTFLDLYIFQTGRRLGKRATGVENYFETEKLVMEAYADMANEKNKKKPDRSDDDNPGKMAEKVRDAYKRGDLDLLDSLDIAMEQSMAFREKFLYRRNEIQAASIDSILKKSSLFVGVGAAHLPGKRGVIELLKKMGYNMRPVVMSSRDALKKDQIDKLKVPVDFITTTSPDGFYQVELPGTLYKMNDDYQQLNRLQYSDMSNGCYYQVTRVKTHTAFLNQPASTVKKTIDSLLYENIPGKIIQKIPVTKSGYPGYDITNKTRRGDLQRYNIFITPFEVLIFKMSGKENYIEGKEGVRFFNSISLQPAPVRPVAYTPEQGGFTMQLPHIPSVYLNTNTTDGVNRWEYEAADSSTGNSYLVMKKSLHNLKFLDEDSFDVKLMEQSFQAPDFFERQMDRSFFTYQGYPCLQVKEKMKDSSIVNARFIIDGPHYYTVAVKSKNDNADNDKFFKSFSLSSFKYKTAKNFTDTFLHFSVTTNAEPDLEQDYRATIEKVSAEIDKGNKNKNANSYWPKNKNASFINDLTGVNIGVNIQQFPAYFYVSDTAKFWQKEMQDRYNKKDLVLSKSEPIKSAGAITGYRYELRDTGSSRTIKRMLLLNGDCMYSVFAVTDTLQKTHPFIDSFFSNFHPLKNENGRDIFKNGMDVFFSNLFSPDSTIRTNARQYISNLHYTEKDVPAIAAAINKLKRTDKNYIETKNKLIAELGYIKDTTMPAVVKTLQELYIKAVDTSSFQNEVIEALARHKTKQSYILLKEFLLQDPPVYDNSYNYNNLFDLMDDSLELTKTLLPEILKLAPLEDYKKPVIDLLVSLADSGLIKPGAYKEYFSQLSLDAKIILKKQQGKEEKKAEADRNKNDDDDVYTATDVSGYKDDIKNYAILLAPFYKENNAVPAFFNKLLLSENKDIVTSTALLLLKNKVPVADSILQKLALTDENRSTLYEGLEEINRLDKFPGAFKNQQALARSFLVEEAAADDKIDSVVFVDTASVFVGGEKGLVYFFKYKLLKTENWKIGISGVQPADGKSVSSTNLLTTLTNKKIGFDKPATDQFQEQLQKLLFSLHKSAARYYRDDNSDYRYRNFNTPDGE